MGLIDPLDLAWNTNQGLSYHQDGSSLWGRIRYKARGKRGLEQLTWKLDIQKVPSYQPQGPQPGKQEDEEVSEIKNLKMEPTEPEQSNSHLSKGTCLRSESVILVQDLFLRAF